MTLPLIITVSLSIPQHSNLPINLYVATTEKYYDYPTISMDKRADAYENALSYTKTV